MSSWPGIARKIRVPLGFLLAAIYVWLARPTARSIAIGTIILVPGLMLRGIASGFVQKNTQLTTGGPYAYTRNPLYLGSVVLAAGFAVAARSVWIVVVLIAVFLVIYLPVIGAEEEFLRSQFPEFAEYAGRVPRLFPRWRAAEGGKGRFSYALYWKHREYNALLGSAIMMGALVAKFLWSAR